MDADASPTTAPAVFVEAASLLAAAVPAASPPAKRCQYFVLSPRPSIESPDRCPTDENADHNILRPKNGKFSAEKVPARGLVPRRTPSRSGSAPSLVPNYKQQACLRPPSPAKKAERQPQPRPSTPTRSRPSTPTRSRPATPTRSRPAAAAGPPTSPTARVASCGREAASHHLNMTPDKHGHLEDDAASAAEQSLASMSVCSEMSQASRFSRLSRRSTTKRHLSSKELEELRVEEKRRQVMELIRRNQLTCRKALVAADVASAGRAQRSVRNITVPQEFAFTPRTRHREAGGEEAAVSDGEELMRSRRLSRANEAPGAVGQRGWRPKLTVPQGPLLHTCQRGAVPGRKSLSCPPAEDGASASEGELSVERSRGGPGSRPPTPERRRVVYAAAAKEERHIAAAKAASARGPVARTAQERAQEARVQAQRLREEQARATNEKLSVFRKAPAAKAPVGAGGPQRAPSARGASSGAASGARTPREGREAGAATAATPRRQGGFGSTARRPCCA